MTINSLTPVAGPDHSPNLDNPWLRAVLVASPIAALVAGIARLSMAPNPSLAFLIATAVIPAAMTVLLLLGIRRRWPRIAAAALLNLEAVLCGAVVLGGVSFALALPLMGIGLTQTSCAGGGCWRPSLRPA